MSPATGRRYPLTMICEVWRVPRSTVYLVRGRETAEVPEPQKRGPKTTMSDEELVEAIRKVLAESDFLGEGHRKVTFRLKAKGIRVGKNRVLHLMREHGLLAPVRQGHRRGDRSHSGRITTDAPNELWGTDATRFYTKQDGWCWFFGAVDHCVTDVVGWHVGRRATDGPRSSPSARASGPTWTATRPGSRSGSAYATTGGRSTPPISSRVRSTPTYVGESECNGVAERFMRTLKEECLYLHDFESLEQARQIIGDFIERYNHGWILERHGYMTPTHARQELIRMAA